MSSDDDNGYRDLLAVAQSICGNSFQVSKAKKIFPNRSWHFHFPNRIHANEFSRQIYFRRYEITSNVHGDVWTTSIRTP